VFVIKVTTLDNQAVYLNSVYIEAFSRCSQQDTIIRLRGGKTYIVSETPEEILQSIECSARTYPICSWLGVAMLSETA
jgi:uncharacterized protein YlzI (FlbEa/FlbD family)